MTIRRMRMIFCVCVLIGLAMAIGVFGIGLIQAWGAAIVIAIAPVVLVLHNAYDDEPWKALHVDEKLYKAFMDEE